MTLRVQALGAIVLVMTAAGLLSYVLSGDVILLTADELVSIYQSPKGTVPNPVIASLQGGDQVPVIDCAVEKDDVSPIVRLPDGRVGYAVGGRVTLRRSPGTLSDLRRVVHGCG